MNKFTRFTLFAGMLAIGLTACGDDVEVVEPQPPPPDPVEAQLQPTTAAIDVGETFTFAVNASGGNAGDEVTWTCSVDDTDIATVAVTDSGCRVTAVDPGNTGVSAAVTKSGETVNVGANLIVREDTSVPATVAIEKVTQGSLDNPVSLNNIRRQVEVTVNIDPGTEIVERVSLTFRGDEIASQTLSPAQAAELLAAVAEDEDGPEAQSLRTITFSWETDSYSVFADTEIDGTAEAVADHLNGQGNLVAQVTVRDGGEGGDAVQSDPEQLTLRNRNGFHLQIDRTGSENTALDVQGFQWRGGRDDGGAETDAGLDAHLIPVIYTPDGSSPAPDDALGLASAQFSFAGMTRVVDSTDPAWTWSWSPTALSSYTMPLATAAFPNQVRDGEYPRIIGNATLSDGQGMGPYGGALDCTGGVVTPGSPIGILNVEFTEEQILCPGGEGWNPPSATLVADDQRVLDPLRTGERIDNEAPSGADNVLVSRPGFPNYPQVPSTPASGGAVDASGVWVNDMLDFADLLDESGLTDAGVSRTVAGFPAPEFLDPIFEARGGTIGTDYVDISDDPTSGNDLFEETATNNVYNLRAWVRDALDNRDTENLNGDVGQVAFGLDATNPELMHTVASADDRTSFDLVTVGADDPTTVSYDVSWTDPITVAASGFSAFAGNPVWRQIHRVFPSGVTAIVGGVTTSTSVEPVWTTGGLANYGRLLASQQPVTGLSTDDGYFIYRSYVLDDAGNISHDGTAAIDEPELEVPTHVSPLVRRQAAIAADQPTVFGITAPVLMTGGEAVTFNSNAGHNFDLGQAFLSLDYDAFLAPGYWDVSSAGAPNAAGGYWTPVSTAAPTQGTTGGVRFQNSDWIIGGPDNQIYDTPFEEVASLVPSSPISRDVPNFIRSIEWVCGGAAPPPGCPAAPTDWADIEANLQVNTSGGLTAGGWFIDEGAAADTHYENNRASLAALAVFDATRWDPRTDVWSGTTNGVLEQIAPDDAGSPFPNRSVSTAPINPVSVPLNEVGGVITSVYADDVAGADTGLHTAWAIQSASGSIGGGFNRTADVTVTARLVAASAVKAVPGAPGQNLFPGPDGRVDFFILEPATGTLRYAASQNNPVLTENSPTCVTDGSGTQDQYRCWDFTASFTIDNLVDAPATAQVLAVGVNATGDGLVTLPVDVDF